MATIKELVPFLARGYALRSVRGETLRPLTGNNVEWNKARGFRFEPEKYSLDQVRTMGDAWAWGVLFVDSSGKHPFILTTIEEIEDAIARGIPGASYGEQE